MGTRAILVHESTGHQKSRFNNERVQVVIGALYVFLQRHRLLNLIKKCSVQNHIHLPNLSLNTYFEIRILISKHHSYPSLHILFMAVRVVEFSNGGYKIQKRFIKKCQ